MREHNFIGLEDLIDWIDEECIPTGTTSCDACPYVVYDGEARKCEKEMYEKCISGELYEDE